MTDKTEEKAPSSQRNFPIKRKWRRKKKKNRPSAGKDKRRKTKD